MSDSNGATEDTRTDQEKAIDKTIMHLRMAIRQLQSGEWRVRGEVFTITPVASGENKAGLVTYKSAIKSVAIELEFDVDDAHENAPVTEITQPQEARA